MRNYKIIILSWVFIILTCNFSRLNATTYNVSNASEISGALKNIQPGDTLLMKDGVWNDQYIIFQADGTSENPIYLKAENPGKVILTGTSRLRIAGSYLTADGLYFKDGYSNSGAVVEFRNGSKEANYCRLTNSAIVDYNPQSKSIDYKWISLYGSHNRVDHCYLKGKNNSGTTLVVWLTNHPNYHLIDHNYFAHRPELGENGAESIRVGTSDWSQYDSYTTVEYNYFEACDGEIEIISNKSCHNVYRYNTFYKCAGTLTLRHGNNCTVEGNYFDGGYKSNSGGIRIIGENHLVFNNYLTELTGSGYRSAISMVNGVPNSPLNRYFQVKNAVVAFNTLINNQNSFTIGAGKSSEQSLPPKNCTIANNLVETKYSPIITYDDSPDSLKWEGNIFYGASLGIKNPGGIKNIDPKLNAEIDSLWRLSKNSPAIDSAVGDFPNISSDFDGQKRDSLKDIGADEYSNDPITHVPVGPTDAGPDWIDLLKITPKLYHVQAGQDSLLNVIDKAQPGAIIELTSDGGVYKNSNDLSINKSVTIRAAKGLVNKPVLINNSSSSGSLSIFVINSGGSLKLDGVILDGESNTATPAKYLIRTDDNPMPLPYNLSVNNCSFKNVVSGSDGNFFRAYAGTFADSIIFTNTLFNNSGKEGLRLKDETSGSGNYNVGYMEVKNCTFWNTTKEAIYIYGGDDNPNTLGPVLRIDHCTFDNCGNSGSRIIYAQDVDNTKITNSILSNSPGNDLAVRLDGAQASISYTDTINVGNIQLNRGAVTGSRILNINPDYKDPSIGNFMLPKNSKLIGMGSDWQTIGDLRWDPTLSSVGAKEEKLTGITDYNLEQNYPNPFNPNTNIDFSIKKSGFVKLQIFNSIGALVTTLVNHSLPSGKYSYSWKPAGNVSSGIFYVRLIAGAKVLTKKMVYLK